jgi:hypothetical protein
MPIRLFCQLAVLISLSEKKRDAPNARQGDDGVNDTADKGALPTTDPSDNIKLEKADAAPVERADNGKDQRNTIQNHDCDHIPFFGSCLKRRALLAAKHSVKDSMRESRVKYAQYFLNDKKTHNEKTVVRFLIRWCFYAFLFSKQNARAASAADAASSV